METSNVGAKKETIAQKLAAALIEMGGDSLMIEVEGESTDYDVLDIHVMPRRIMLLAKKPRAKESKVISIKRYHTPEEITAMLWEGTSNVHYRTDAHRSRERC